MFGYGIFCWTTVESGAIVVTATTVVGGATVVD
jgi:hypothetical protein